LSQKHKDFSKIRIFIARAFVFTYNSAQVVQRTSLNKYSLEEILHGTNGNPYLQDFPCKKEYFKKRKDTKSRSSQ